MTYKIKVLLLKKKMTIKELATKLNTSSGNLSNKFARDNFSERELQEIAEALNCDLDISFVMRDTGERL